MAHTSHLWAGPAKTVRPVPDQQKRKRVHLASQHANTQAIVEGPGTLLTPNRAARLWPDLVLARARGTRDAACGRASGLDARPALSAGATAGRYPPVTTCIRDRRLVCA